MRRKAQLDFPIITFFVLVFGLILLAPIMLKIFISIKEPVSAQFGNMTNGGDIAQANFNKVMNTAVTFWDKVIVAAFILAVLLLIVSAIFIDANPLFVILYVVLCFFLILFAPSIVDSLDAIYDSQSFTTEVSYLTFVNTLRTHFPVFLVGIMVFTGIIIFGKIALTGGSARR